MRCHCFCGVAIENIQVKMSMASERAVLSTRRVQLFSDFSNREAVKSFLISREKNHYGTKSVKFHGIRLIRSETFTI